MTELFDTENYFAYFTEVEEYFIRKRGKHLLVSPLDWCLIEFWKEEGVPLHIVLRGIDRSFENAERRARRPPTTLAYCHPAVMEAFAEYREAGIGGEETGFGDRVSAGQIVTFLDRLLRLLEGREEGACRLAAGRLAALRSELEGRREVSGRRLEQELAGIAEDLAESLWKSVGTAERKRLQQRLREELQPYRKHLAKEALAVLRKRHRDRLVLECFGLPSFSLLDVEWEE
ncbi:MAG: hypothetical protein Kow00109_02020 [Acidobacteriota bacterium]